MGREVMFLSRLVILRFKNVLLHCPTNAKLMRPVTVANSESS
jgi:hypothetical protein